MPFPVLFFGAALLSIVAFHLYGVFLLILNAMLPLLVLRMDESARSSKSRNELLAGKIADAAEEGSLVVAVVGDNHTDDVYDHLAESLNPK